MMGSLLAQQKAVHSVQPNSRNFRKPINAKLNIKAYAPKHSTGSNTIKGL